MVGKKKLLVLLISAILIVAFSVTACSSTPEVTTTPQGTTPAPTSGTTAETQTVEITMGNLWGGGHVQELCDLMKEYVGDITDGRVQITILPGSSVAPVEDHLDAVSDGVFDLNYMFEGYYQAVIPAFNLLSHPNLLREPNDIWKISKLGGLDELSKDLYAEHNITFIGRRGKSSDAMVSTVPVPTTADVAGIKIRSEGANAEALDYLGASTVFIDTDDVYVALSSGLIDADNTHDLQGYYESGFYEIAKYWVMPPLSKVITLPLVANTDFWNGLSAADQKLIELSFLYACEYIDYEATYNENIILAKVQKDYGVTIQYWDDASQKQWADALSETTEKHPEDAYWQRTWDLMLEYDELMGY